MQKMFLLVCGLLRPLIFNARFTHLPIHQFFVFEQMFVVCILQTFKIICL